MKIKRNADIKAMLKEKYITYYDLGLKLGVCTNTIGNLLNSNLSKEKREELIHLIKSMKGE